MRKLTKQEILNLQPSDEQFYVVLNRITNIKPILFFAGLSRLHIQRSKNRLVVITPKDFDWAEGSSHDIMDNGDVLVEDYEMQIFIEGK